jgi:hypothetical protein
MLWIFFGFVALILILWGIDIYRHRHPLTSEESLRLAQKRRRVRALFEYRFSMIRRPADPAEKKAMKSQGEFVSCDMDYHNAPTQIAGLLKYKKHEWIVILFITSNRVFRLWWNKGSDGTRVWSFLGNSVFQSTISAMRPDAVAIIHNHPNPDPWRYQVHFPSEADLRSAGFYDGLLRKHDVTLLEFVCERGTPHLYYASFTDRVVPVEPILRDIQSVNGTGVFKNYSLRKELERSTNAEQVAGGNGGQAAVPHLFHSG